MHLKKFRLITVFFLAGTSTYAQDTTQQITPGRLNSREQQAKPYVILISADGFRPDLAEKYNAINLLRLRAQGVQADYMQSSFPSLTYPNHHTIITGLYPSHHGLVDNIFYDPQRKQVYTMNNKKLVADSSWYGGTPLWVLSEKQQMLSASYYWVASEIAIQGVKPTYYHYYNEKTNIETRIQTVKKWLQLPEDKRPHFISFYFPEVDHAEHVYGIDSKETEKAVRFVDEYVGKLVAIADTLKLPVNFVFVSDHGMTSVDLNKVMPLPPAVDTAKFYVPSGYEMLQLYAKEKRFIKPAYKAIRKQATNYNVYLAKKNVPRHLHYRKKDDRYNRIGDILLIADPPAIFNITRARFTSKSKHGYDPSLPDIRATFYAWGPAFKENVKIRGFENIHVYPLIATILGLTYNENEIDGRLKVLKPLLK